MTDLTVTLIQSDIHWQETDANMAELEEKIWQLSDPTELIVLPEMFNTGFTMQSKSLAEPMNGRTFKWMKQMAGQTGAVITGSLIIREQDHFYNRLIWMNPDGTYHHYDKRHLFRMAEEDRYFSSGKELLITDLNGWNICPMICYDLIFTGRISVEWLMMW
jgi:omega-amidase